MHNSMVPLTSIRRPALVASDEHRLLILLHGLAADENDLIGLAPELDDSLDVISLRAPYETGYGGYCWFRIEFLPDGRRIVDEDQALATLDLLVEEIQSLARTMAPAKLILGGFSQGAMMSAGVLFRRPDLLDAAWLMSGRLIPSFDPSQPPGKILPVLQQHGLYDEVLPAPEGRELAEHVRVHGHALTYREYAMAHQIGYESLADAVAWFASI
jgi:phospholipase/carboxylesterase